MPRLKVRTAGGLSEYPLNDKTVVVGRIDECDIVLDDDRCSRKHCEFVVESGSYVVRDLGSSNGTLVNGSKTEQASLCNGDEVKVGRVEIVFTESDTDFELQIVAGEKSGDVVPLAGERVTFGRRADNTVTLKDVQVSGLHLEVVREGEHHVLRDLGSTNGTILDGKKVEEVTLSHGDRVKVGGSEFVYVDLGQGSVEVPLGGESVSKVKTLSVPLRKGKAGALLSLGVLILASGGAAWFFLFGGGTEQPTSGRAPAVIPTGTKLTEDWSFEDRVAVSSLWNTERGTGFSARRGGASSGSYGFACEVENDAPATSVRQAVPARSGPLTVSGKWSVDQGCTAAVELRFLPQDPDTAPVKSLELTVAVVTGGTDGGFAEFAATTHAPPWTGSVAVGLVARGSGEVVVDDLSLVEGGMEPPSSKVGEFSLRDRGGSFAVELRKPLLEFFRPWDVTTNEEGETLQLSPGCFDLSSSLAGDTASFEVGGSKPQALVVTAYPELAEAGVVLLRDQGAERQDGSFDLGEVKALFFGTAAQRLELVLDPPCRVVRALADDFELRVFPPGNSLTAKVRTDFEAEREEANRLLDDARRDHRADRWGAAILKLRTIADRLPYNQSLLDQAMEESSSIVAKVQAEIDRVTERANAAEFLGSLERTRAALAEFDTLLMRLEGADVVATLTPQVERMGAFVETRTRELHEEEARRLVRLIQAYQGFEAADRSKTAQELTRALLETYGDTEAAREFGGGGI